MKIYDRSNLPMGGWRLAVKKRPTKVIRIIGPFKVKTLNGIVECKDGYLAVDSLGWPYPISIEEFRKSYIDYGYNLKVLDDEAN